MIIILILYYELYQVSQEKIDDLWRLFLKYDREMKGNMTLDDFFDRLLKYPRTGLTDAMTKLIGIELHNFYIIFSVQTKILQLF